MEQSLNIPFFVFLFLAYLYTWFFHYRIVRHNLSLDEAIGRIHYLIGIPGPAIAAVATASIFGLLAIIKSSFLPITLIFPWWLLAVFVIPAIYLTAAWISSWQTGKKPKRIFKRPVMGWTALLLTQLYVVIAEETGWRGFALPLLSEQFGSTWGTIILGFIWALWHLPMFSVQTSHQKGALRRYIYVLVMWSFIMTVIIQGNHGNILPALIFHASANISFFTMNISEEADRIADWLLGFVAIGLVAIYLI
jgi:membrane protease YdiL (CAAX protease family)